MTATEHVILVDENDNSIGTAEKLAAHRNNLMHRAFSVFIFRNTGNIEVLLQQRAHEKYHSANLWTNTCCSHPRPGEDTILAGERRLYEEIGIHANLISVGRFHYIAHFENGLTENEVDHVLIGMHENPEPIIPNPAEVQSLRWESLTAVESELDEKPETFTPWFRQAFALAKLHLSISSSR